MLFASYNNVPIDNVFEKLSSMKYRGKTIPFPVLRLGNTEKVMEAIKYINELRTQVQSLQIFASTLDKRKDDRIDRAKRLSARLKEYEEILDLKERKETLTHLMKYQEHMKNTMKLLPFQTDLQGYQMQKLDKRIAAIGEISDADAMQLLDRNEDEFYQYLFYTSARYIKALEEPKFQELRQILDSDETPEKLVNEFNKYMRKSENVRKLQRVFPIIITTCISAHKIGEPEPLFDMTIMDEASQCNVAISLVPIIRGEKLMLVGDPQQLNPVILLGELTNKKLRRRYHVSDEYDYRENSIYKTYLACDAVSDEVLLRNHYRCNKEIIGFNNKKYYNSKLKIQSKSKEPEPLVYMDVKSDNTQIKNTSPAEVEEVVEYALLNKDKSIAVITPFVNQKQLIENAIKQNKLSNLVCGTVHAFQGDEKDVVLFCFFNLFCRFFFLFFSAFQCQDTGFNALTKIRHLDVFLRIFFYPFVSKVLVEFGNNWFNFSQFFIMPLDIALHFFLECGIFFAVFFQVLRFMNCFKPLSHNRIGRLIHISNLATQCVCIFGILIYIFKRLKLEVIIAIIADIFGAFFKHFFKFGVCIFSVKGSF